MLKLVTILFIAFGTMMLTVAMMGSFMDHSDFIKATGGTGLYIWLYWIAGLSLVAIVHHFYKKNKND